MVWKCIVNFSQCPPCFHFGLLFLFLCFILFIQTELVTNFLLLTKPSSQECWWLCKPSYFLQTARFYDIIRLNLTQTTLLQRNRFLDF